MIKDAVIICKECQKDVEYMAPVLKNWLAEREIASEIITTAKIPRQCAVELAIVLGGDGTILGAARKLAGKNIPILGINFGKVGFLTAFDQNEWRQGLMKALEGKLAIKKCLALRWRVMRADLEVDSGVAINDIVLSRGAMARITNISVNVNNALLGELRSDGIIVSAPLGSTGYSASAGGPIVHNSLEAISLAPICPFMMNAPAMLFEANDVIELAPIGDAAECYLTIDGQECRPLAPGDSAYISGYPGAVPLMFDDCRFFARLHGCGMWR